MLSAGFKLAIPAIKCLLVLRLKPHRPLYTAVYNVPVYSMNFKGSVSKVNAHYLKIKNLHILFITHFKVVLWYEHNIMCIKHISFQDSLSSVFFYEWERVCSEDNCGLFNKCLHFGNEPTSPPLHATFKTVSFGKTNRSRNVYTSFL